ncbi:MAG: hypothetical protein J6Y28_09295 [Acholeplasmatales bacterium]|nr:hypothetical protein [Acholeplasmatales bacterium]
MFYEESDDGVLLYVQICLIVFCALFVGINLIIGIIRYKKIKNDKTVGTHNSLKKLKLNQDIKSNDFNLGYHIYADKEKNKWVIIIDNPKECNIFSFPSLEDYVLTYNGEYVVRSSMKNVVREFNGKKVSNITLDVFCKNKKFRFQFLNKECNINDSIFNTYNNSANGFCDVLEYILENK